MELGRAGNWIMQPTGYKAFVPKPLPPNPPLVFDGDMLALLSLAERSLGRLDGVTRLLPNPDLFVDMFVRKESLLSSQIEGTQASFTDIVRDDSLTDDVQVVSNYVSALRYGLSRVRELPISLRLLREIHGVLLATGRGSACTPGMFRTTQNWVGPPGCDLANANYVPPSPFDMGKALADLENFLYDAGETLPPLIRIALIHAQFETIHPFLDGNGRVGRLLITFWLVWQGIVEKPLLYLSLFFKRERTEYYDRLMRVRTHGDWEGWVRFFLRGVAEVSNEACVAADRIISLHTELSRQIAQDPIGRHGALVLDALFACPDTSRRRLFAYLEGRLSCPTIGKVLEGLVALGVLERGGTPRRPRYRLTRYLAILEEGTE